MKIESIRTNGIGRSLNFGTTVKPNELTSKFTSLAKRNSIPGFDFIGDIERALIDLSKIGGDTVLELSTTKPLKKGFVYNRLVLKNSSNGHKIEMPNRIELDHFAKIIRKAISEPGFFN